MARPREFEMADALDGAMQIFWRQGYKATNLPELLDAMGLTRGSFYKAFGDKKQAYLAALDRYDEMVVSRTVKALETDDTPDAPDVLMRLFADGGTSRKGCFICNAMVELAPDDPEIAARTWTMAGRLRDAIGGVLRRFAATGRGRSVEETADVILHLYFGHQAMGKAQSSDTDWHRQLRLLLENTSKPGGVGHRP